MKFFMLCLLHPPHMPCYGALHGFVPSCPTQKYSNKKKKPENTNLWLKTWLHVTNLDHK